MSALAVRSNQMKNMATGQLLERSEELARIEAALVEAPRGARDVRGHRGAGWNWQDGAARGGAYRSGRRRNARAPVAGNRAGTRVRLRSGAPALRAAAGGRIGARARRSAAGRRRRGGRPPRASGGLPCGRRAHVGRRSLVRDPSRPLLVVLEPGRRRSALPDRSTTPTGQTPHRCATWPSCSRASKSWTPRSS